MVRSINISSRYPKIRGIKRRLDALNRWSNSFAGYFPVEYCDRKYWNCKIPVLDILVNPPTTTRKIQARCACCLIQAANHLLKARPLEFSTTKVTALITYPNMFGSEICVFLAPDYFDSFFNRNNKYESLIPARKLSLTTKLGIELPLTFTEMSFIHKIQDRGVYYTQQWWSIIEK